MLFDKDKIKDMEYDPERERFVGKDGSEFKTTMFSDGKGCKYDYYDKNTYGNSEHNSEHIKIDLNGNYEKIEKKDGVKKTSSGIGCYLTTACMNHYKNNFDDNCRELTIMRWFRDNVVTQEDISHYYETSPIIVEEILKNSNWGTIFSIIYKNMIVPCVEAVESGAYDVAYKIYKDGFLTLERKYAKPKIEEKLILTLKQIINL